MTEPYYQDPWVTLYLGNCLEIDAWLTADVLVTDPPYPNNGGHFDESVQTGSAAVARWSREAVIFWSEVEHPPVALPLVAVHIWHRTNVNGKPYEPAYHYAPDARKRRSMVFRHAAIHPGMTGSDDTRSPVWASGHPTQKPVGVMENLLALTGPGIIADPFAGSGPTLVAAKALGLKSIGVELEERFCEVTARRLSQDVLDFTEAPA